MRQKDDKFLEIVVPVLILIALTFPFYIWKIDILWQKIFFKNGEWFLKDAKIMKFLYDFGPIPAIVSAFLGLITYILSYVVSGIRQYRKLGLFLFLYMVIGSGVVVNAVLKEYWGRPRPREIVEFGGEANYIPPAKKGEFVLSNKTQKMLETQNGAVSWDKIRNLYKIKGKYNSFPAGHASVGFYMIFPFFIYKRRKNVVKWLWFGGSYGMLMGLCRNIQGGHFLSDVIWAGFVMYFTGISLYYLMKLDKKK